MAFCGKYMVRASIHLSSKTADKGANIFNTQLSVLVPGLGGSATQSGATQTIKQAFQRRILGWKQQRSYLVLFVQDSEGCLHGVPTRKPVKTEMKDCGAIRQRPKENDLKHDFRVHTRKQVITQAFQHRHPFKSMSTVLKN
eukprot:1161602-Pelagomonas_calceolata.AAC.8